MRMVRASARARARARARAMADIVGKKKKKWGLL
jgi:hypothetical protein